MILRRFHTCVKLSKSYEKFRKLEKGKLEVSSVDPIMFSQDKDLMPEVLIKPVKQIMNETNHRFFKRYVIPSEKWLASLHCDNLPKRALQLFNQESDSHVFEITNSWVNPDLYETSSKRYFLKPVNLMESTLDIGDLCILENIPNQLMTCVELPTESKDSRYGFAKVDGTLVYVSKNNVKLRLPSFYSKSFKYLISEETNHGFDRIGFVKNDKDRTFSLSILARQLGCSLIPTKISQSALEELPIVIKKLELIHRYIQTSMGPWQIPLFKIVELVSNLQLTENTTSNLPNTMSDLLKRSGFDSKNLYSLSSSHMNLSIPTKVDASTFLATYWALLQQQETLLWGRINIHRGLLTPISVTVLPLRQYNLHYHSLLQNLRENNYKDIDMLAYLINKLDLKRINLEYSDFLQLLRDYIAGNFQNNGLIISIISRLFRRLTDFKDKDVTKDLCFQLLKIICPETPPNPLLHRYELPLSISSKRSSLEQKIYDLSIPPNFNVSTINDTSRHDFKNLVCYCIDSEAAHEIDDGISIEKLDNVGHFKIHIHIADPASWFLESTSEFIKNDPILDIAFQRSFTTYLPDKVIPMLPISYCRASDLGNFGTSTKTISFSIECKLEGMNGIYLDFNTFKISRGIVISSKRITYDFVDKILNSERQLERSQTEHDLNNLYEIAKRLRLQRIHKYNAIVFGDTQKGLVYLETDSEGELTKIKFKDQLTTKSNILVSELMIMTNTLTGRYFKENNIPGIFRGYKELKLKFEAYKTYQWLKSMSKQSKYLSSKEITKAKAFFTNSFYTSNPTEHAMIGAPEYLTVTSPLRRFPDMINHLQLHKHLHGSSSCFTQQQVNGYIWHILSRDVIIKNITRDSNIFWTLTSLKNLLECKSNKNSYTVMVTSLPSNGFVHCFFQDKLHATGRLKIDINRDPPVVGNLVTNCKINKIDCLDGLLDLEMEPNSLII